MTETLKIGSFERVGTPGSPSQHYFRRYEKDEITGAQIQICLESCMAGYCVAIYDEHQEIITEKRCTKTEGFMDSQIAPGFSMLAGDALESAVKIANEMLIEYRKAASV